MAFELVQHPRQLPTRFTPRSYPLYTIQISFTTSIFPQVPKASECLFLLYRDKAIIPVLVPSFCHPKHFYLLTHPSPLTSNSFQVHEERLFSFIHYVYFVPLSLSTSNLRFSRRFITSLLSSPLVLPLDRKKHPFDSIVGDMNESICCSCTLSSNEDKYRRFFPTSFLLASHLCPSSSIPTSERGPHHHIFTVRKHKQQDTDHPLSFIPCRYCSHASFPHSILPHIKS